ncbi:MAG: ATP-binding protein [Deltaproteobacteria bacterium]|nr:ATP-binding protein [Deltaproteobacteria bacterium]
MPGRKGEGLTIFARPWSFREYMDFFYPDETRSLRSFHYKHVTQEWLGAQQVSWRKMWDEYCVTGGFPRAIGEYRREGTVTDMTYKIYVDWILGSWSKLRTPERSLCALAKRLRETLNSRVSYESLKKGTDIQSSNTIRSLMEIQEDRFSVRSMTRFDPHKAKFLPSKLKKIYPLDPFIARVWAAIGDNIRRRYHVSVPAFPLDECAFQTQTLRRAEELPTSYLYSETTKSEIDFFFDGLGFELKSNGKATPKQRELLKCCEQGFVLTKDKIPLMAYLVGEGRS